MPSPPSYRKVNPADQPILFLVITSPTLPMWQLNEYADTLMAQHISMINGVAQVNVFGQQRYAVHIQVDPFALAKVNEIARQTLPASGTTSLQGTAQPFESSMKGMDWLLVLTIVFIYIVLGILYESFVHPIMMTTMAALMAALPLALAAGSDSRRQLSLTAVGGLLISQLVTLYLTPLLFTYLDGLQQFVRQKLESFRGAKSLPAKPVEA
jgi:multidrug efflux pump subunit AcrB